MHQKMQIILMKMLSSCYIFNGKQNGPPFFGSGINPVVFLVLTSGSADKNVVASPRRDSVTEGMRLETDARLTLNCEPIRSYLHC